MLTSDFAFGTYEAVLFNGDAVEAAAASPPLARNIPALKPVIVDNFCTLWDVLKVVISQMSTEVVSAAGSFRTSRVATVVLVLARLLTVCLRVMPLEVRCSSEGPSLAIGRKTDDGPAFASRDTRISLSIDQSYKRREVACAS